MKRCPHCEFIYNDDQSACDMDGNALVYDTSIIFPAGAAGIERRQVPSMLVVAISGLVLALVAWLSFLFTLGPVSEAHAQFDLEHAIEVPSLESPLRAPEPVRIPAAQPQLSPAANDAEDSQIDTVHRTDARLTIPKGIAPLPRLQPLPRLAAAKPSPRVTEIKAPQKDSTVKSFLKKTGRVLKKPFRF